MAAGFVPIFDLVRDSRSGTKLGRFEIICKLGKGGMSEVFLAWQRAVGGFERVVVLKRILSQVKGQNDFVEMFVQEAKITSGLSHGNVAQLFDLAQENDELFMVIEFVPGATLVEIARACGNRSEAIPPGLALALVKETALALHYAHTFKDPTGQLRPVVHRDVSPKNIMVSLDGKTKLLDFGIAHQRGQAYRTQSGTVKGTSGYMSPEQVRAEKLDGRSDVFALGVVLHECLTGEALFKVSNPREELESLLRTPILSPRARNQAVSAELEAVVMTALSRDRDARFATALQFAEAIDALGSGQQWNEALRADFMNRHFQRRRDQIRDLLGPAVAPNQKPAVLVGDDDLKTDVAALRPVAQPVPLGDAPLPFSTVGPLLDTEGVPVSALHVAPQLGLSPDPTAELRAMPFEPLAPEPPSEVTAVGRDGPRPVLVAAPVLIAPPVLVTSPATSPGVPTAPVPTAQHVVAAPPLFVPPPGFGRLPGEEADTLSGTRPFPPQAIVQRLAVPPVLFAGPPVVTGTLIPENPPPPQLAPAPVLAPEPLTGNKTAPVAFLPPRKVNSVLPSAQTVAMAAAGLALAMLVLYLLFK